MNCPRCNGKTRVYGVTKTAGYVARRRKCVSCDRRFGTVERREPVYMCKNVLIPRKERKRRGTKTVTDGGARN